MSRVHDALRRAAETGVTPPQPATPQSAAPHAAHPPAPPPARPPTYVSPAAATHLEPAPPDFNGLLDRIQDVVWNPSPDSLLIDPARPLQAFTEEFRTLRTRLNHMQSLQPMHTLVVTSASPAEGKSFTAMNLALAQAQLAGNRTLVADFDFRRPILHTLMGIDRSPGITDYLLGKAPIEAVIRHVANTNLYVMPAGEAVINPLELLNLTQVRVLMNQLPTLFNWVILDTPPLLFAADANLLSTLCHSTVLVVRIGSTTIDTVTRAMQSLCENNVVGIVVNGARSGELYSKYSYYHSYYTPREGTAEMPEEEVPVTAGKEE